MEKVVTKVNQKQQKSDFYYWQKQSHQKRLEALEEIRREYHQYQYNVEPRFQRVYTIIKR
ncbi:toxin secretion, membrane fusion protein [Cronbergia sp. UHCC 0137]|uniref:toxin secretion, membrane fusion protein n=1 Tax=Cronbergia sp. UHCC 0137 TaxID=3110239 RepID=UPI002B1EDCEE|nr:toxin secretion, membrane fusion protein [Cronbergia sp. UHCC 0137]MEA5620711.1 toxin secretion, membrane fusion protein [Cronbergia sp. UHCC 0137]